MQHISALIAPALNASTIESTFQTLKDKQTRACLALSKIQTITSDAEDQAANDLLVKVRVTLEGKPASDNKPAIVGMKEMRMEVTKKLDAFKASLMEPETLIITEADRVKKLRNAFATMKNDAQKREQQRIANEKAQSDEIARIKAAMRANAVNGMVDIINELNENIRKHVNGMTLDNWEVQEKKFNIKPILHPDKYASLFNVIYNQQVISNTLFEAVMAEIKDEYSYKKVNGDYIAQAEGIIKMWRDDLPAIKAKLIEIEELKKIAPIEAEKQSEQLKAEQETQAIEAKERITAQQSQLHEIINRQHDEERLNNEIEAQVQQQTAPEQKNVRRSRVAVLSCPDAELPEILTAVLRACLSHPKFKGHLKRDRKGNLLAPDENGMPVYADWLATLLEFIAKESDKDIPGITWKEVVSSIAK
jgi:hypothetical protein